MAMALVEIKEERKKPQTSRSFPPIQPIEFSIVYCNELMTLQNVESVREIWQLV